MSSHPLNLRSVGRIRPRKDGRPADDLISWDSSGDSCVVSLSDPLRPERGVLEFNIDDVVSMGQADFFDKFARESVDSLVTSKVNTSIITCGAPGAGKSHTAFGSTPHPGILYHSLVRLFEKAESVGIEVEIRVSVFKLQGAAFTDVLPKPLVAGTTEVAGRETAYAVIADDGEVSPFFDTIASLPWVGRGVLPNKFAYISVHKRESIPETVPVGSDSPMIVSAGYAYPFRETVSGVQGRAQLLPLGSLLIADLAGSELDGSLARSRNRTTLIGDVTDSASSLTALAAALTSLRAQKPARVTLPLIEVLLPFLPNCLLVGCVCSEEDSFRETHATLRFLAGCSRPAPSAQIDIASEHQEATIRRLLEENRALKASHRDTLLSCVHVMAAAGVAEEAAVFATSRGLSVSEVTGAGEDGVAQLMIATKNEPTTPAPRAAVQSDKEQLSSSERAAVMLRSQRFTTDRYQQQLLAAQAELRAQAERHRLDHDRLTAALEAQRLRVLEGTSELRAAESEHRANLASVAAAQTSELQSLLSNSNRLLTTYHGVLTAIPSRIDAETNAERAAVDARASTEAQAAVQITAIHEAHREELATELARVQGECVRILEERTVDARRFIDEYKQFVKEKRREVMALQKALVAYRARYNSLHAIVTDLAQGRVQIPAGEALSTGTMSFSSRPGTAPVPRSLLESRRSTRAATPGAYLGSARRVATPLPVSPAKSDASLPAVFSSAGSPVPRSLSRQRSLASSSSIRGGHDLPLLRALDGSRAPVRARLVLDEDHIALRELPLEYRNIASQAAQSLAPPEVRAASAVPTTPREGRIRLPVLPDSKAYIRETSVAVVGEERQERPSSQQKSARMTESERLSERLGLSLSDWVSSLARDASALKAAPLPPASLTPPLQAFADQK